MKTFTKICLCIGMLVILLGSLPFSAFAEGETELPLFNTLSMDNGGWSKFAVSPDGKMLYTGGGENSYIWHLDSGRKKEIEELQRYALDGTVEDAAFSPDGKLLAVAISGLSIENRVMLFASQSGELLDTINITTSGFVGPIQFSHDGEFLIAGVRWDRISIIDMTLYKEVYDIPFDAYIQSIRTNPTRNEFAIANSYSRNNNSKDLQIRNTGTGEIIKALGNTLPSDDCEILDMNYSPDGKYFIISFDKNCGSLVYDVSNQYEQLAALDHGGSISFSKDSRLAIIGDHVYPITDKFKSSYGLKIKNTSQVINPQVALLTPDDKYFITTSTNGLNVLDASSLSIYLTEIQITPKVIALAPNESQPVEVKGIYSDGTSKILNANAVKWTVKDFYLAEVKNNVLLGLSNGSTELTAEYGGYKQTNPIVIAEYPSKLNALVTDGKVAVSWSSVSNTKELAGYNIYRRAAGDNYSNVPLTDFPLQSTQYTDENVDISQHYYYIVKAVYANQLESRASNEASSIPEEKRIILQVNNPIMKVNDVSKEIDPGNGTTPVMYKGRTVLPVRSLIEELGGNLVFNNDEQKLTINLNDNKIDLWIGKNEALVNGSKKTLDVAPVVINKRTMLPLRFISEQLGLQITWDGKTQTIELSNQQTDIKG